MRKKIKKIMKAVFGDKAGRLAANEEHLPQAAEGTESTLMDAHLSGWFRHDTGELFDGFPIEKNDIVLDIGCGDGPFTQFCAKLGAEIIIADVDAAKIKTLEQSLKNSNAKSVKAIITDANPIPLESETISKIIAMEVLEHVEDPAAFMQEIVRVGKPGALYLITVPDSAAENIQKKLAPESYFQKPNHIRIFERSDFKKLILNSGLTIEKEAYYGFYWSMWWFFFWGCKQDLTDPWHPVLEHWTRTWNTLLTLEDGPRIKRALDESLPKSQAIIARKPRA